MTIFSEDANKIAEVQDSLNRPRSWLEFEHHEYTAMKPKWMFIQHHYSGEVVDQNNIRLYLIKKSQGESEESYYERIRLCDFPNHFAAAVDSLSGMMFQVEGDANRTWTTKTSTEEDQVFGPMGDPDDQDSTIYRLNQDADGQGSSLPTLMKVLATELTLMHRYFVYVDAGEDGEPLVKLIEPQAVTNWRFDGDNLVEVMVQEQVDTRKSLQDPQSDEPRFLYFNTAGWQRWKLVDTGAADGTKRPVKLEEGDYKYVDPMGRPSLPIFRVVLPMKRFVGYMAAWKQNILMNKESERDHLLRACNFPKLVLAADTENFDTIKNQIREGANLLSEDPITHGGGHRYIAPPDGPATIATTVIDRKTDSYYATIFRDYGQHARQKTATESKQDLASGVGAFLSLLKTALDDAENGIYWRVEQTLKPGADPVAHVERTDDFLPTDIDATIQKLSERYNGTQTNPPLPVGRTAKISAMKQILSYDGVDYDTDELENAVDSESALAMITANPSLGMALPPEVQVWLVAKMLASFRIVDPDEVVDMGDDQQPKLLDVVLANVAKMAQAQQQAQMLGGQPMSGGVPGRVPMPGAAPGTIKTKTTNSGGTKKGKGQRGGAPTGSTAGQPNPAPHIVYPNPQPESL